jgi:hypothetical protein
MSNKKVCVIVFNLVFIIVHFFCIFLIRDVHFRSIALQYNIAMTFTYNYKINIVYVQQETKTNIIKVTYNQIHFIYK